MDKNNCKNFIMGILFENIFSLNLGLTLFKQNSDITCKGTDFSPPDPDIFSIRCRKPSIF